MLQGKVIDADGHILEPPDLWKDYLEAKYRDRAIRMEKDAQGFEHLVIDGRPSVASRGIWATDFPHWDASPAALRETREAIASLPKNDQQYILGDNVARVLNLT